MYNEVKTSFRKHIDFIIFDILAMEASFFIAYFIRHGSFGLIDRSEHRIILIILLFANLVSAYIFNTMQDVLKRPFQIELYATIKQVFLTFAILIFFVFITKTSTEYSRNVFLIFPILYFLITLIIRTIYKSIMKKRYKNVKKRELLIITTSDRVDEVKNKHVEIFNDYNIKNIYLLDKDNYDLYKYVLDNHIDEALICLNGQNDKKKEILENLNSMGLTTHIEIDYIDSAIGSNNKEFVENIFDYTCLTCTPSTISLLQIIVKRLFDIIFSIIGIIFVGLFIITIGLIIKIKSPGPIFFIQKRVGKNGKIFNIYKFRSMYVNADKDKNKYVDYNTNDSDMMFKMDDDPRVIKGIGSFIRKTSIDEFPQFINVLKGDMSLVGTRPPTLDEWGKYLPHHRARMTIKPGITGLWQVSGRSEIKDFEKVVALDKEYINNFSIALDIAIILKTFKAVILRVGAK